MWIDIDIDTCWRRHTISPYRMKFILLLLFYVLHADVPKILSFIPIFGNFFFCFSLALALHSLFRKFAIRFAPVFACVISFQMAKEKNNTRTPKWTNQLIPLAPINMPKVWKHKNNIPITLNFKWYDCYCVILSAQPFSIRFSITHAENEYENSNGIHQPKISILKPHLKLYSHVRHIDKKILSKRLRPPHKICMQSRRLCEILWSRNKQPIRAHDFFLGFFFIASREIGREQFLESWGIFSSSPKV